MGDMVDPLTSHGTVHQQTLTIRIICSVNVRCVFDRRRANVMTLWPSLMSLHSGLQGEEDGQDMPDVYVIL